MRRPFRWVYSRERPGDFAAAGRAGEEEEAAGIAAAALREAGDEVRRRRLRNAEASEGGRSRDVDGGREGVEGEDVFFGTDDVGDGDGDGSDGVGGGGDVVRDEL